MNAFDLFSPTKEHAMIRDVAKRFALERLSKNALKRDQDEYFDLELFKELGDLGFLGITASEEFGGSGLDAVAAVIVHEELSKVDPGMCLAYLAHSMLCVNNISQNGSLKQKEKYLPKLCSGEYLGAIAMSETHMGTDVLGMKTSAQKTSHGYVINGQKMWITNGVKNSNNNTCDVLFLYAKIDDKISSFIITGDQSGFRVGQKLLGKLGMRASNTAELILENCEIKQEQLVGHEGDALKHMMRNLEIERLTLAAMGLGIMGASLRIMNDYANERKAFGLPINCFGQIQTHIAESFAKYRAARSYVYHTAHRLCQNPGNNRLDSDGVKLICSRYAKEVADSAIQVLGGNGYMAEYKVERLWRDAKLLEIGGGTIEAHQKNIAMDLSKNSDIFLA